MDRLLWAVGHYGAVVVTAVVCVLVLAVALTADDRRQHGFEASALVVNTQPELRPAQLPRLGLAVFASTPVAERLTERLDLPSEVDLIPLRVSVDPVPRSVVFRVTARTADPISAVQLVNAAAETFAEELNGLGGDLGEFQVHVPAAAPARPIETSLSLAVVLVVAVTVSVVVTVGLLSLLVHLRPPVLTAQDAVLLTGVPVISWDAARAEPAGSRAVAGVSATTGAERSLALLTGAAAASGDAVVLAGDRSTLASRRAVACRLGLHRRSMTAGQAVMVDEDLSAPADDRVRVVVIRRGSDTAAVRRLVEGSAAGPVIGCLLLRRTRRDWRGPVPRLSRARAVSAPARAVTTHSGRRPEERT